MNTFHVTYFLNEDKTISKGVNIDAESMIEAIATFNLDFNGIEPINIVNKNLYANIRPEIFTSEDVEQIENEIKL